MITIEVEQGSSSWRLNRYGIITASEADEIITPKKWQATSAGKREKFVNRKCAERQALRDTAHIENVEERCIAIEKILNRVQVDAMMHGTISEPRAVADFELLTNRKTVAAGFVLNDARTAGASVDRMIVGEGRHGLEAKCPYVLAVYIGYCFTTSADEEHLPQLLFQTWIAELETVTIYPWFENRSESVPITVERTKENEEKIEELAKQHSIVSAQLESRWAEWSAKVEAVAV